MPLKSATNSQNLQNRRAVNRLFHPQGLGVLYSQNRERTYRQLVSKFNESTGTGLENLRTEATPQKNNMLYDKYQRGSLNVNEFKELATPFLPQGDPNTTSDLVQYEYFNYIKKFRPLTKDERYQQASAARSFNEKMRFSQRANMSPQDILNLDTMAKDRANAIRGLKKQGLILTETGLKQRGPGEAIPGIPFSPAFNFSPNFIPFSPDNRMGPRNKRFK